MNERELYRQAVIKSNWIDEYSFDNYYFIKDGKYAPVSQDCKEFADWLNIGWVMWQLSANRQGYKIVPVDELLMKVQNIRDLNTGEYASDEIEENVCEIEAMIGVVE